MIEVVPYCLEWAVIFNQIREKVWPRLRDIAISMEHVGSTSVPGLYAKPIVDIAIVVSTPDQSKKAISALEELGYEHRGDLGIKGRAAFRRPQDSPKHNLYVELENSLSLKNHLLLKKHLLENADARDQYSNLKLRLARKYSDSIDLYIEGKTSLIVSFLKLQGVTDAEVKEIEDANKAPLQVTAETLVIGVSACLVGRKCNFDGRDLFNNFIGDLDNMPELKLLPFCPEDKIFGTPRPNLRIVGGDGNDVLDGKAKVINEAGDDVTAQQIEGARQFLSFLIREKVDTAILMDGSPSCGSNVLLKEDGWPRGDFKKGLGVSSALLRRNGIRVFSSFDELATSQFLRKYFPKMDFCSDLRNLKDNPTFQALLS